MQENDGVESAEELFERMRCMKLEDLNNLNDVYLEKYENCTNMTLVGGDVQNGQPFFVGRHDDKYFKLPHSLPSD